jgi:hypothetical protein
MQPRIKIRRAVPCVIVLTALLAGCAGMEERSCEMQEAQTRGTKPVTTYTPTELKPG